MELYNGKIKSITQPADSVIVCVVECYRSVWNGQTKKSENVLKPFPIKCFGWVKNHIAKHLIEGDYISLVAETMSKEHNGNFYIDLICKGIVLNSPPKKKEDNQAEELQQDPYSF